MTPWIVLQLADSAFPAGSFAHSSGVEAAGALGLIGDGAGAIPLDTLLDQALTQAAATSLPFVAAAHAHPAALAELDALCEAQLLGHVQRRASRAQGRALTSTARRAFAGDERVETVTTAARTTHAHLAPVFGALHRALDVGLDDTLGLFLHGSLRQTLSAAVRLGHIGPMEAQHLQRARSSALDALRARFGHGDVSRATQTHPLLDLFANRHDELDARLFQS